MRAITAEEVSQFWADGVVHLPQVLDADELARLDQGLNESVEPRPVPGGRGTPPPAVTAHRGRYDIVTCIPQPGDIIVHYYKTLHGSDGTASSDRVRRAISVRYCADDGQISIPSPGIAAAASSS